MGTQQLLLIVLGVIVVGIAVVVGITIFGSNAEQANKDAVTQDCLRIAAAAQGYYNKPSMLGGGNHTYTGIDLTDCGMSSGTNANGTYTITSSAASTAVIVGTSAVVSGGTVTITCTSGSAGNPVFSTNW
jgi:hypothetical protein